MLRVCLDDVETLALLVSAAEDFARAETPNVTRSFMLATMTALQKKDGGVRSIASGIQTVGGQHTGQTIQRSGGDHLCPLPICSVNWSRRGLCGARCGSSHRRESRGDGALHRRSGGTRPCFQECDDGEAQGHTKSAKSVAVRPIGVFQAVMLQVEDSAGICHAA